MKGVRWHYILILVLSILMAASVLVFWPESSEPVTFPPPSDLLITWDVAANYAGEIKIVEGPVVGGIFDRQSIGKPTRLQIGKLDSDTDRFSVFFWMDHREKFMRKFPPNPETYLLGKTVRVRGFIDDPKGYPQIVLSDPADIWIVE